MSLKTKIAVSLSFILILFLILSIVAITSLQQLIQASNWVEHTHRAIGQAKTIQTAAIDMETGARGFLLAGKDTFLQPYLQGINHFDYQIKQLQITVSDNPEQVRRLEDAEKIIQQWRKDWIEVQIALRRQIGDAKTMNDMAKEIAKAQGKTYFDRFRQQINTFINREQALLTQRNKQFETVMESSREHVDVLNESSHWVVHTHEAITAAKVILTHAVDMETGIRGFLLSGDEEFLQPYERGKQAFFSALKALQIKVSDNPSQVNRLTQIETTIQIWVDNIAKKALVLRYEVNEGKKDALEINQFVAKKQGKQYFDNFRRQIAVFIQAEQELLVKRTDHTETVLAENKQNLEYIKENDYRVEHTYLVMTQAYRLLAAATDMETGKRGFLLSGKEEFLEPYIEGKKVFKQILSTLKQTVSDNPSQVVLLEELSDTLTEWQIKVVEPLFALRRTIGDSETMDDMADLVAEGKGQQYFDQFRQKMAAFIAEEESLMEVRQGKSLDLAQTSIHALFWGTAILLLVSIGAGIYIIREILHQVGGEPAAISKITAHVAQGNLTIIEEDTNHKATGVYASVQQMVKEMRAVLIETAQVLKQLAEGDMNVELTGKYAGDFIHLKTALESTASQLAQAKTKNEIESWLKSGQTQFNEQVSGEQDIKQLAENIINFLTPYVNAKVGVFHLLSKDQDTVYLKMIASHAYVRRTDGANTVKIGEGLIGQAAYEKKMFTINHSPENYMNVQSSLGEIAPTEILVIPFLYELEVKGVIEIASLDTFTDVQLEFLSQIMPNVAIAINTAESRDKMQILLEQSQAQAEELTAQQEQMQEANEELRSQTEEMQAQQEELQAQQEELRQTNEELKERDKLMTEKQVEVKRKNQELEKAKIAIQAKAEDLELASKYKSEFLANMSHELRTPLNSLLILAQLLLENQEQNLTTKQLECAQTIYSAGTDLLTLINEILDLSKVEAGKVEIHPETIELTDMLHILKQKFTHVAEEKSLYFEIKQADNLPSTIYSDNQRLNQIINNLLSNAFKFTQEGGITLEVRQPNTNDDLSRSELTAANSIAISITDTGIGIPKDKQKIIFEAFQQADGTTSRRFGGTGLGLSISRQLAQLMGGEIQLHSEIDQGSRFTIFLPKTYNNAATPQQETAAPITPTPVKQVVAPASAETQAFATPSPQPITQQKAQIEDDRDDVQKGDKSLLIIEDEQEFAQIIQQLAKEKGFKCLMTLDGRSGIELAEYYRPSAIILDVGLPEVDGLSVMEHLKDNVETRHIPVHFISGDMRQQQAKQMGAIGYALKPVSLTELGDTFSKIEQFIDKHVKSLLVITDSDEHYQNIADTLNNEQVDITRANNCTTALDALAQHSYECLVLDLTVEDNNGIKLLTDLAADSRLLDIPIIIYPERPLTEQEESALDSYNSQLTLKTVASPTHLLDEATLFLHQVESHLPEPQREMLKLAHDKEAQLRDKKILLVDDDARNVFALTATLESKGMKVFMAPNGKKALEQLEKIPDIDIVLMDIMMPEMDGYETMQKIRQQSLFRKLPIIALTAKAMKDDANKCIEAGASDYLAKPVETSKLLSLMRVWVTR
ncbi:CHASE3 domain-containing protein [Candidatus Albibeggiatoa sp. nov. NOAA]|uniref:CHASE3 domain-containing protein n=1 Tax=Candidatus Albibeggiatoa sp. nov. NOAA TaxID=3162724 RepID=UPI003300F86F|nr:CHASE3 domain-containing protein [Thiotrichaceae bacterium]